MRLVRRKTRWIMMAFIISSTGSATALQVGVVRRVKGIAEASATPIGMANIASTASLVAMCVVNTVLVFNL